MMLIMIAHLLFLAKSEHPHPIEAVKSGQFGAENGMKTALKNGAYPFKSAKIVRNRP